MAINSLETAVKYSGELDKVFEQKSVVNLFTDNNLRAQFMGAKTVKIRNMDFVGLVDYDRDGGFSRSKMTVASEPFELSQDRARSIMIDREDLDETGIANLAGQVLGEYVRTKVVPECDAYCLSKLAGIANQNGNMATSNLTTPFKTFTTLVKNAHEAVGYDEELVCFVDGDMFAALQNSTEYQKQVVISDFKQGEISLKVKSIDGVPIIPVSSSRMKSSYDFVTDGKNAELGGFTPAEGAVNIRMLVVPKKAAHLVKKTEKLRIFTPDQNQDADAYKFDYRIYYDIFVKKSQVKAIQGCASGAMTVETDEGDEGTDA